MKVHFITHGKHKKGAETAATYDGPLTEEARAQAASIQLPPGSYLVVCGSMRRHLETLGAIGKGAPIREVCGNDADMFAMLDKNDQRPAENFWQFLNELKTDGHREVMIVTSRGYVMIPLYFLGGGAAKFGACGQFMNTLVAASAWPGTTLPVMESGKLITIEI